MGVGLGQYFGDFHSIEGFLRKNRLGDLALNSFEVSLMFQEIYRIGYVNLSFILEYNFRPLEIYDGIILCV